MRRCEDLFLDLVFIGKLDSFWFFSVAVHNLWPLQYINDTSIELTEINLNPSCWASFLFVVSKDLLVPGDCVQDRVL